MGYLGTYLGTDLGTKLGTNLAPRALPFSKGTYANASPRNLLARPNASSSYSMTGPFAANTLATRTIGGSKYGLFEGEYATGNTYSEVFRTAISNWSNSKCSVSDNAAASPLGGVTADKLYENTDNDYHHAYHAFTADGSSQYCFGCFVKAAERTKITLRINTNMFVNTPECQYNLSTGVAYNPGNGADFYGILPLLAGWYFCYVAGTSDAAGTGYVHIYTTNDSDAITYLGDGSSGAYIWGANVIKASHLTSYIQAVASVETKAKDVFYWANATLPVWLKGSANKAFSFNFIPNHSSVQHAAKGVDTFLFSVDGTENVECYIAGADQKLYIDVDSVNKFTSASAFAWDMHDTPKVTIIPNNGSNCRVITSGFNSGNADETGTIISMQDDGDLYWAMRHTTNDLQLDGLQSEPRAGMV